MNKLLITLAGVALTACASAAPEDLQTKGAAAERRVAAEPTPSAAEKPTYPTAAAASVATFASR